jgi:predicted Zn-dependent peptidase
MLKPISLKNKMTVLRFPKTGCNTFLVGFVVKTGSAVEDGNFPQGISQLVEKMFWKGTYKHASSKHLNLALENLGGVFYSTTYHESTQFFVEVPDYNQYKAISFLAEVIQRSYFDARDIEFEKRRLVEKLKEKNQNMDYEINEATLSNLYSNSTLGLPVDGYIDTLNQISATNVLEYLSHQYNPEVCSLVLAGSFESKKTLELLEQEWNLWNPKAKKIFEVSDFESSQFGDLPKIVYRQRGMAQTYLSLVFALDEGQKVKHQPTEEEANSTEESTENEIDHKELIDDKLFLLANLMVINSILGQGFSSRLWLKGVEEEFLFNHIESRLVLFSETGFLQIAGNTENMQFTFGLECILSTLDSLKRTTVSINELSKAKAYLKGRLIRENENLLKSVLREVDQYLGAGFSFDVSELVEKIDSVEASTIRSLALDLFVPQRMSLSTLGTAKETKLVDKLVKQYLG